MAVKATSSICLLKDNIPKESSAISPHSGTNGAGLRVLKGLFRKRRSSGRNSCRKLSCNQRESNWFPAEQTLFLKESNASEVSHSNRAISSQGEDIHGDRSSGRPNQYKRNFRWATIVPGLGWDKSTPPKCFACYPARIKRDRLRHDSHRDFEKEFQACTAVVKLDVDIQMPLPKSYLPTAKHVPRPLIGHPCDRRYKLLQEALLGLFLRAAPRHESRGSGPLCPTWHWLHLTSRSIFGTRKCSDFRLITTCMVAQSHNTLTNPTLSYWTIRPLCNCGLHIINRILKGLSSGREAGDPMVPYRFRQSNIKKHLTRLASQYNLLYLHCLQRQRQLPTDHTLIPTLTSSKPLRKAPGKCECCTVHAYRILRVVRASPTCRTLTR